MKPTDLINQRLEELETVETFAKRVYDTAKRYRSCLFFTARESNEVIFRLAKYYKESYHDILCCIRYLEFVQPSKKYRIQWVKCLNEHYLVVDKRQV